MAQSREQLSLVSSYKNLHEDSTLTIQLLTLGPKPNSITLRIGDSMPEFWEDTNMQS